MCGDPIRPAIDAVLMMLPLFCFSITGSTCFIPRNTPTTLTSSTRRNISSEYSRDRLDVALDAGVVVERVDGAEFVDGGADVAGDLVLIGDVGGDRQRLRRGRQILDRFLEVLFPAVDRDEAGAAFGQKPHGRGADDAGSPGDDGDPAVQANSIGHCRCFPCCSGCPGCPAVRRRDLARTLIGHDYFICGGG